MLSTAVSDIHVDESRQSEGEKAYYCLPNWEVIMEGNGNEEGDGIGIGIGNGNGKEHRSFFHLATTNKKQDSHLDINTMTNHVQYNFTTYTI